MTSLGFKDRKTTNIPDTIEKADRTCRAYSNAYPNARIHIGSVAPSNEKHIEYNRQLKNLASQRKVSFISTDTMFDRTSGQLRPKMVTGIHYTTVGLKTFCKEIKRSLYRRTVPTAAASRSDNGPSSFHPNVGFVGQKLHSTAGLGNGIARDPRQEIQNFLSMAISRLGSL